MYLKGKHLKKPEVFRNSDLVMNSPSGVNEIVFYNLSGYDRNSPPKEIKLISVNIRIVSY